MSIVHDLGPNSAYIGYNYFDDYETDVYDKITTWLESHGWSLHDNTTISSYNHRVLKSDNTGDSEKYLALVSLQGSATINFKVYEYWDETTHIGVNQVFMDNYNLSPIKDGYTLDKSVGGSFYMFATKDYVVFHHKLVTDVQNTEDFIGVFGFKPFNNDFNGIPAFGMATPYSLLGVRLYANDAIRRIYNSNGGSWPTAYPDWNYDVSFSLSCIVPPRNSSGKTGMSAAKNMATAIAVAENAISRDQLTAFSFTSPTQVRYLARMRFETNINGNIPINNDPDTGNPRAYTFYIKEMEDDNLEELVGYRGKIHGIKVLTKNTGVGNFGDIIKIPCDNEYLMTDTDGTDIDHFILCYQTSFRFAIPL